MFICKRCGQQTSPGEKMHKLVTKKRKKFYSIGIIGWEIIKEIPVCKNCMELCRNIDE